MPAEITYYSQNTQNKNELGLALLSETRTVSGTSAKSGVTPSNADTIRVYSAEANRYAYAADADAVATATAGKMGHYIPAGGTIDIQAVPGWKLAFITAA